MGFRPIAALVLFLSVPCGATARSSDQPLRLRNPAPTLSMVQAKRLSAEALGDLLLAPGHPVVSEAVVGPQGMEEAPPPPNTPVVSRIKLYLQPRPSEAAGFCQRTVASLYFSPVDRLPSGELPPSKPDTIKTQTAYRWVGNVRDEAICKAPRSDFFTPAPAEIHHALEAVRLLAEAHETAKRGDHLVYPVSVDDKMGRQLQAWKDNPRPVTIFTDGPEVLSSLSVDQIYFAGSARSAYPNILTDRDLAGADRIGAYAEAIFQQQFWQVGLIVADGHIVRMRLVRDVPAPF